MILKEFENFIASFNTDGDKFTLNRSKRIIEESYKAKKKDESYTVAAGLYQLDEINNKKCVRFSIKLESYVLYDAIKSISDNSFETPIIDAVLMNEKLLNYTYDYDPAKFIELGIFPTRPFFKANENPLRIIYQDLSFIYYDNKCIYTGELEIRVRSTIDKNPFFKINLFKIERTDSFDFQDIQKEIDNRIQFIHNYYKKNFYKNTVDKIVTEMTDNEKILVQIVNI